MAYVAAGGEDGRVRKVGPDATYLVPEPEMVDPEGNFGVRMKNGDEFWRLKIRGQKPLDFNVQVKTDPDGVRWYSLYGGAWTRNSPWAIR
jgi:hypothetical protein